MPPIPALNITDLLKGIPQGAWVAISSQHENVVAFGPELRAVMEEAASKGEHDALITRVPESSSTQIFPFKAGTVIHLTAEEQYRFAQALLNPPPPGRWLRAAVKRYMKGETIR